MNYSLSFLALALLFPAIAEAQSSGITAGARVRVTAPRDGVRNYAGTITEIRGDTVVVAGKRGSRSVALDNVTALDVSSGTRTQVMRSGLIGFGVGALVGMVSGAASYEDDGFISSPGEMAAIGGVAFGAIGLVAGGVVGGLRRTDRWQRRDLPVRAAVRPFSSGGLQLVVSGRF